jgi:hypothetical protein
MRAADGVTWFLDFLGIAPDPGDRRYWALGEAVEWSNASGDVSTATAFRLGRMCDPATHQCAP